MEFLSTVGLLANLTTIIIVSIYVRYVSCLTFLVHVKHQTELLSMIEALEAMHFRFQLHPQMTANQREIYVETVNGLKECMFTNVGNFF